MRVLLISTNREQAPQTVLPLGTCCVAEALQRAGHTVTLLDLCGRWNPVRAVRQAIRRGYPEVIALSVRNLDNGDMQCPRNYLPEVQSIIAACPATAHIVLGGPAVSLAPEAMAREMGCRYTVSGEGERTLPALLAALARGDATPAIPGVTVLREDGTALSTPIEPIDCLDELADPDLTHWLDLRRYRAFDASYPLQSKRGCALRCSYCSYPALEGRRWRLRDPAWVAGQMRAAAHSGLRLAEFVDSVFGLPQEHALACCSAIAGEAARLPCCTMDLNPAACTPALIEAMNAAGFAAVGIAAESAADRVLQRLGKDYTTLQLRRASASLHRLRARTLWFFLLGAPGENEETVRETINFIEELPHDHLVFITQGIRVLPGTVLHAECVRDGTVSPGATLLAPTFTFSPEISPSRLNELLAGCRFPGINMMSLHDGGHRLAPLVQRMVATCGLRPPFWRYLPAINRLRRWVPGG